MYSSNKEYDVVSSSFWFGAYFCWGPSKLFMSKAISFDEEVKIPPAALIWFFIEFSKGSPS